MAEETVYLNERGIKVTNARVVCTSDTYALANITSCKARTDVRVGTDRDKENLKTALTWGGIVLGVLVAFAGGIMPGLVLAGIGIIASMFIKPEFQYNAYRVLFGSSSGEQEAVTSDDEAWVRRVVDAVNEAIIGRG